MSKPIITLDFDGVCHSYSSGWKGAAVIPDPAVAGLFEFLAEVTPDFEVAVFSSRSHQDGGINAMKDWFAQHCPSQFLPLLGELRFPLEKPPAFIGIDDRVLTFDGTWPSRDFIKNFQPWNKKVTV